MAVEAGAGQIRAPAAVIVAGTSFSIFTGSRCLAPIGPTGSKTSRRRLRSPLLPCSRLVQQLYCLSQASRLLGGLRRARASAPPARRLASAADPVQKLFLDKIREYKKKSGPGGLVEPSKAIQKEMKTDVEKLLRQYGGAGEDMNSFPSLNFGEPKLDPPDEQVPEEAPRRRAAPPQTEGKEQRGAPTDK